MNRRSIDRPEGRSSFVGANPAQQGEHLQQGRLVRLEHISCLRGAQRADKQQEATLGTQRRSGDPPSDRPTVFRCREVVDGLLLEVKEEVLDGSA